MEPEGYFLLRWIFHGILLNPTYDFVILCLAAHKLTVRGPKTL